MKNPLALVLCALVAACSSSENAVDPRNVKFTYGPGQAPVGGTLAAAEVGESGIATAEAMTSGDPDGTLSDPQGQSSIVTLADQMAEAGLGDSGAALKPAPASPKVLQDAAQKAVAVGLGAVQPTYAPSCITVVTGDVASVTYQDCTETVDDPDLGITWTIAVNGSLTRTRTATGATIGWRLVVSGQGAVATEQGPVTFRHKGVFAGEVAVGDTTIVGTTRSDTSLSASFRGQSDSASVTHLADYDLTYATAPFCLTGGTIEVRRVWTNRPEGATADDLPDGGLLFTFGPQCGQVVVAFGGR